MSIEKAMTFTISLQSELLHINKLGRNLTKDYSINIKLRFALITTITHNNNIRHRVVTIRNQYLHWSQCTVSHIRYKALEQQ